MKEEQKAIDTTAMQSPPRPTNQSTQQDVLSPMTQTTTGTTNDNHSQDISTVTASTASNSSTARTTKPPKYITTSKWKDDTKPLHTRAQLAATNGKFRLSTAAKAR